MEIPAYFVERLAREFRGRLRIRWSPAKEEFHIEQQVGRGTFEVPFREGSDVWHRVRDGYAFVMSINPRDFMFCRHCHKKLAVPVMETAEVRCGACNRVGRDAHYRAAYYPLNDRLIDWLKRIDPERRNAAQEMADEADAANTKRDRAHERETHNHIESATLDNWKDLAGIARSTRPR